LKQKKRDLKKMELIIYIIGFIFTFYLLYKGTHNNFWPFTYLGLFSLILIGIMLFYYGVNIQSGATINTVGDTITIANNYTNYTTSNFIVSLIANTFFYGGIVGMFFYLTVAFKKAAARPPEL